MGRLAERWIWILTEVTVSMRALTIIVVIFSLYIPLHAMHLERIERFSSDECDIENQRLIPLLEEIVLDPANQPWYYATKARCVRKSDTYCNLLANVKKLPPRLQTPITDSINEEIKDWKSAIRESDYKKIETLFEQLENTLIRECNVSTVPIFQSENATCCWIKTAIIERSFTREFAKELRAILELNNLEKTKDLASVFKKWRLYFTHLSEAANSEFHKKLIKESALTLSPTPLPIASLLLAIYNYYTLSYIGLGLTAAGVAGTQVAIRKFGIFSAYKPLCIHEELVKVQLSLSHFEHAIAVNKAKLSSLKKIKEALQKNNIQQPFGADFLEKLKKFDELCDDSSLTFPTNLAPLKEQRNLIIKSLEDEKKP